MPWSGDTPNPGSDEALALGCLCPVLDNGHGNPEIGAIRGWWINDECPLHGSRGTYVAYTNTTFGDHVERLEPDR